MKMTSKFLSSILIASCFAIVGCSSYPKFDIQVSPSKELAKVYGYYPTVEVDIVALSEEDAIKISHYPLEKYFEPSNPIRKYFEPLTLKFSDSDLKAKLVKGSSNEYEKLMTRAPSHIVMIANLPFSKEGLNELDPRIYIYRIGDGLLDSHPDLFVKVGATGLIRTSKENAKADMPEAPDTDKQPQKIKLNCKSVKGEKNMVCKEEKQETSISKK